MAKSADLKAVKKRNGKFMVKKRGGGKVNGSDKLKFLVEKGLVKQSLKKKEETPAPEA